MQKIKEYVLEQKASLKEKLANAQIKPYFAIVQVGNVEASNRYVRNKIKDCNEVGIKTELIKCPDDISEEGLHSIIDSFNNNKDVTAVMVQFPLPKHLDEQKVASWIDPKKDADGFTNNGITNPATPQGIITYLERNDYEFQNKNALVIGRSNIVGKPMAKLLLAKNCNVTVCHSKTSKTKLDWHICHSDLIICATGRANLITKESFPTRCWNNIVIFDVGINFTSEGKLVGDCEPGLPVFWQSPVPSGCGLLTRLQLLENIIKLYEVQND